jgi:hypothetical protein
MANPNSLAETYSFVSLLSDAGVPVEDTARLVGHRSTTVTETGPLMGACTHESLQVRSADNGCNELHLPHCASCANVDTAVRSTLSHHGIVVVPVAHPPSRVPLGVLPRPGVESLGLSRRRSR